MKHFIYTTLVLVGLFTQSAFPVRASVGSTFTASFTTTGVVDSIAPTTPVGVTATPVSQSQINLSWTPSTDNIGVAGYVIFRDASAVATTSVASFVDTGLVASTTYTYEAQAFDTSFNYSSTSAAVSTTTLPVPPVIVATSTPTTSPVVSGGTSGTPFIHGLNIAVQPTEASVTFNTARPARSTISWGTTSDLEGGSITSILYDTTHAVTISNLVPNTHYFARITVVDARGNQFASSIEFVTPTLIYSPLVNPSNFSAQFATVGRTGVNLTWTNPNDARFDSVRIVRSESFFPRDQFDGVLIYEGARESFFDATAIPGKTYYYAIFAKDANGAYSSGALAQASSVVGTNPFVTAPQAGYVDPLIARLTIADFEFIQQGKDLMVNGTSTVMINGMNNLTIRLPYNKVPEVLKTIAVSLTDPKDSSKAFIFLLRANTEKTYYEASIGALNAVGSFPLAISILDYQNQSLKQIAGSVQALVFAAQASSNDTDQLLLLIILVALVALVVYVIRGRRTVGMNKMTGATLALILVFGSFGTFFTPQAHAAINQQINYQGKLTNASNIAVADGSYIASFSLYTAPSGGAAIWTELDNGSNKVVVRNGLFSVMLGSTTPLTGVDFNQTLYLGVTIESDSEMTPRKVIGTVPSAIVAQTLQNITPGQLLRSDIQNSTSTSATFLNVLQSGAGKIAEFFGQSSFSVFSLLSNGNVGVGTSTPGSRFAIAGAAGATTALFSVSTSTSGFATTTTFQIDQNGSLALRNGATLTLNNLNGPLQANNGVVSATSSVGVLYGGTGITTAPAYGNLLIGNNTGGYTLTATSSLGLANLTATNSTLTFSGAYNGSTARTVGINLANSNTWTVNQAFNANDSTSGSIKIQNGSVTSNSGVIGIAGSSNALATGAASGDFVLSTDFSNIIFSAKSGSRSDIYIRSSDGYVGIGTTSPFARLSVDGRGVFNQDVRADYYTATSTSIASTFPYASTTALTVAGTNGLTVGTLNGPLQANNGTVSATSSIGVLYGGTGLTTAPTYGQVLVGNALGGYTLTATSSLGFPVGAAYPFTSLTNYGATNQATTGIAWFQNGLNASSTSHFVNASTTALTVAGNLYVGSLSGLLLATNGTVSSVSTSSLNLSIPLASTTGTLGVANGGTGATAFGQGWIYSVGGTGALSASTSPTVTFLYATSTSIASTFPYASTTALTVSNGAGFFLGSLNGPLQANNGKVSATSSVGVLYGGTGLTTAPSYGNILVGNALGGYTLTATSSLGITGVSGGTAGMLTSWTGGSTLTATGTPTAAAYYASSTTATSTFMGGFVAGTNGLTVLQNGNVGIGNTAPLNKFDVTGSFNSQSLDGQSIRNNDSEGIVLDDGGNGTGIRLTSLGTEFRVDGNNGAFLFNSGNVGIGTSSPFTALSVMGNGYFAGNVTASNFTATSTTATSTFPILRQGEIAIIDPLGSAKYVVATTSTDVGRGNALKYAVSIAQNGSSIYLASTTYDLGNSTLDLSRLNTFFVHLHGAGKYSTVIKSTATFGVLDINSGEEITDLSVINPSYIGINSIEAFRNVLIKDVYILAGTVGMSLTPDRDGTGYIENVTIDSKGDGIQMANGVYDSTMMRIFIHDSDIRGIPGGSSTAYGIKADGVTAYIYNTNIDMSASGGATSYGLEVSERNDYPGYLYVSGGQISSKTTDLVNTAGTPDSTLSITANTIYDVSKATGTLAYADANQIIKSISHGTENLGLGSPNPTHKLEVNGTSFFECGDVDDAFSVYDTPDAISRLKVNCDNPSVVLNNLMTVTEGAVGIGTSSPFTDLSVVGNGYFTGNLTATNITATGTLKVGTLNGPLQANNGIVSATTSVGVRYGGTGLTTAPSYGNILVGNNAGGYTLTATSSLGLGSGTVNSGLQGQVAFYNANGTAVTGTSTLFVGTNGNVGVGTTSSSEKLTVNGNLHLVNSASNAFDGFTIDANNGETGILRAPGASSAALQFIAGTGNSGGYFGIRNSGGTNGTGQFFFNSTQLSQDVQFETNFANSYLGNDGSMNLNNTLYMPAGAGSIGIGTDAPGSVLHLKSVNPTLTVQNNGADGVDSISFVDDEAEKASIKMDAGNNLFSLSSNYNIALLSNNNVGIGTAAPAYALDVNGFVNVDGAYGYKQDGTTILVASSTTLSVLLGGNAGASLTDPNGLSNTAIGFNTLSTATSSVENTAVGYNALANNGTNYNTAVGTWSMYANTFGIDNTAIGGYSLRSNTTGSSSAAGGTSALQANTTGSFNTAFGKSSLRFNTTGSNNTALGFRALFNSLGTGNIGIGYSAGKYETGSDSFYVDNQDRTNTAGDKASALLYGKFNATAANQTLVINASTTVAQSLSVLGSGASYFLGNLGIGTSSPFTKFAVMGDGYYAGNVKASNFTATSSTASSFPYASTTALTVAGNLYVGSLSGLLLGTNGTVSAVSTSSLNLSIPLASTTGTLGVANGGTGATAYGQGWIYSVGGTTALSASTSPTVNYFTATSTTIASTFPYASTTALTVAGTNGLKVGTLNGPLQANNGTVSATSSVGVLYGGTGLTTAPAYGQVLVGNALGGYTLTATSSLGITGVSGGTAGMLTSWTGGSTLTATGTPTAAAYYASSTTATSTFRGGLSVAGSAGLTVLQNGNVGIGTASPSYKLHVAGTFAVQTGTGGSTSDSPSSDSFTTTYPNITANSVTGDYGGFSFTFYDDGSGNLLDTGDDHQIGTINYVNGVVSTVDFGDDTIDQINYTYSGTYALTTDSSGKVGIGTLSHLSNLDVGGNVAIGSYAGTNAAPTNGLIVSGNVGIGTASPEQTLHVKGPLLIEGNPTPRLYFKSNDGNWFVIDRYSGQESYSGYFGENGDTGDLFFRGQGSFYFGDQSTPAILANGATKKATFIFASSTAFSTAYASSTRDFVGTLNLPNITGTQCLHSVSGVVSGTGSDCASVAYPFTSLTNYGATNQATTGIAWFQNGINASSTSHFVNASTTVLSATAICISTDCRSAWPTGGGSGGGSWSTTTSQVTGRLVNYSNNTTDIVAIGANSTTTAKYWFDPNTQTSFLSGNVGIGTTSPFTALSVMGNGYFAGNVTASNFTATSTVASTFPYASTTALTVAGTNGLTVGTLNGPLQANNGTVSATSSVGVLYGGTGLTTAPTYGQILVGNNAGGYTLTATSSLGLPTFQYPFTSLTNYGATNQATTGIAWFQNGLNASSTSHFVNASTTALTVAGNLYVGSLSGLLLGTNGTVSAVSTSSLNLSIPLASTTGTLGVANGGTGATTFSQGWIYSTGGTTALSASTSPTVNYFTATSTSIASTFPYASTTAFSATGNAYVGGALAVGNQYIVATGTNAFASGYSDGAGGLSLIKSTGVGSVALGYVLNAGSINSNNSGSVAVGYAGYGNSINSQAAGSFAGGNTTILSGNIVASGAGSFVWGSNISATQSLSTAFGKGFTNSTADTFQVGYSSTPTLTVNTTGVGIGTTSPYAPLSVNGQVVASYFTATTSTASVFPYASTTALTVAGTNGLTVGTLNGPLQANNGTVSATSSVGVLYGGTGLTTAPTYGQVLVGNALGGYTLTATSSLGFPVGAAYPFTSLTNYGATNQATTGIAWFQNGLNASSTSHFETALFNGNVGIGTTSPFTALSVMGNGYFANNVTASYFTATSTTATSTFAGDISVGSGGSDAFVVDYSGNVGIGTSTPWKTLSVAGSMVLTGGLYDNAASAGTAGYVLMSTATGVRWVATTTSSGTYSFTPLTNFGATNQATTGIAWFQNGLNASSTSHFDNASTTVLSAATICISTDCRSAWPTGGGSGSSSWSTTTSSVAGRFINYSNNTTDIVTIGGNATTTAKYWFDPNAFTSFFTGNVGIGTTSPFTALSVMGSGYFANNVTASYFTATSTTATSTFAGDVTVGSGSDTYFIVDYTGNVGIGSTTPYAKLSVSNGSQQDGTLPLFTIASTTNQSLFAVLGNGNVTIGTTSQQSIDPNNPAKLLIDMGTSQSEEGINVIGTVNDFLENNVKNLSSGLNAQACQTATANNGSDLTGFVSICANNSNFYNPQTYNVGGGGDTSVMSLASGDFYINNATANKKLYFMTGGTATSTNIRMTVDGNGNVGIGTTTPNALLALVGQSGSTGQIFDVASSSGASYFHITSAGNIGIGTSSPFAKLSITSIAQNGGNSLLTVASSSGSTLFTVLGNGNVGIGTSSPLATLHLYNTNTPGAAPSILMGGNNGGDTDFWMARVNDNDSTDNDFFQIGTGNTPGTNPYFSINRNGYVGVGTTSPFAVVSIANTRNSVANTPLLTIASTTNGTATSTLMTVLANGSIGMGSSTPSSLATLSVSGSTYLGSGIGTSLTIHSGIINYPTQATSTVLNGLDNVWSIATSTTNTPIFSISTRSSPAGLIGIGTSSPFGRFSLEMGTMANSLWIGNQGSSTPSFVIAGVNGNGSVGVATNTPSANFAFSVGGSTYLGAGVGSNLTIHSNLINYPIQSTTTVPTGAFGWSLATSTATTGNPLFTTSTNGATSTLGFFVATTTGLVAGQGMGLPSALQNYMIVGNGKVQAGIAIVKGGLCVDSDGWCTASTTGRVTAVSSTLGGSDVAEMYSSADDLKPGEIVSASYGTSIVRASKDTAHSLMGIVSTDPGLILGLQPDSSEFAAGKFPIALNGRVPVRVSNENGPIAIGDPITISSVSGVGMRATGSSTKVVAIALEPMNDVSGTVMGFVQNYEHDDHLASLSVDTSGTLKTVGDVCAYGTQCLSASLNHINDQLSALSATASSTNTGSDISNVSSQLAALQARIDSLASSTVSIADFASTTSRLETLSTSTLAMIASTTATTIASSTTFIQSVALAVYDIMNSSGQVISSAGDWSVHQITAAIGNFQTLIAGRVETQTAAVSNGLEMKSPSGQTWCVRIDDMGNFQRTQGSCDTATSTPVVSAAPVIQTNPVFDTTSTGTTTTATSTVTTVEDVSASSTPATTGTEGATATSSTATITSDPAPSPTPTTETATAPAPETSTVSSVAPTDATTGSSDATTATP